MLYFLIVSATRVSQLESDLLVLLVVCHALADDKTKNTDKFNVVLGVKCRVVSPLCNEFRTVFVLRQNGHWHMEAVHGDCADEVNIMILNTTFQFKAGVIPAY